MSTTEIEAAAEDVPGVSSVVALPDSTSGEVWLVVNGPVTPQAVLRAVGTRLEPQKRPDRCVVLDELPLTPNGKIDRLRVAATVGVPLRRRASGPSACWLGAAQQSLRDLVSLLRSRRRPDSVDLSSDLLHERIARIRNSLELVSSCLNRVTQEVTRLRAAGTSADDTPLRIHLNTLKVTAAELTFEAADGCVQIAGLGSGYMRNPATPFERTLRDLRSAALNYADPPPSRRAVKERET